MTVENSVKFIKAHHDYYGTPDFKETYINTNYIIKMDFMGECEDSHGNIYKDHYVIEVDRGKTTQIFHISLKAGEELLKKGGVDL